MRLSTTDLTTFDGAATTGVVHDRGAFDDHPGETAYSGYTGETFPTPEQALSAENLGWDLSHARRLVHVYGTLFRHRATTGSTFPSMERMRQFTAQYAYASFNHDLDLPLFNNFVDGHNGWYRVGYHGDGFGYAPFDLSIAAYTGGFGFWAAYNPDIDRINRALWRLATEEDAATVTHREAHYGTYYNEHERVGTMSVDLGTSLSMLSFLPVFAVELP